MGKSLLARGLGKLKRDKTKRQKNAARASYAQFLETLPVNPQLVVLEARNGRVVDGSIYYLLRQLAQSSEYQQLQLCLVTEDDTAETAIRQKLAAIPEASQRVRYLRLSSEEYFRAMATAGFIINDATIGNFFVKREGQVYLNVWHGTPLKTMGRRVSHEPHAVGNVQKNFIVADYLLYPSDYMMEHMVDDYMIANLSPATVLMGGYPRNIAFFDDAMRAKIREELTAGAPGVRRIYAYMPTWRPNLIGEELQKILEQMEHALKEDELMCVNVHPLAKETVTFSGFTRVRPFPENYENYAALNAADALLTDYSSVFYDYAVTGRKIVLLTYDEKEYFATRGLYEPISSLPFPQVQTAAEALEELRTPKAYDDAPFLTKYCAYDGPEAAEVLCRRVFLGEPCMEERSVPGNGLPSILVYGGDLAPGPRTDEVMAFLASADQTEANFYLTFNRGDLKERFGLLFDLPEGIDYIGRAGKMLLDPVQEETANKYRKGKCSFEEYWRVVRPAFARERKRFYGETPIRRVIQIPPASAPGPGASKEELEFSTYETYD